jgi:hypothetical protein
MDCVSLTDSGAPPIPQLRYVAGDSEAFQFKVAPSALKEI